MFVNVCSHPRIDPVCGANLLPVSEEHLDTWGLGNARVPLLVGPTRAMLDSDGRDATAVDVLFHPAVVRRALTGGKSVTKEHFRDYLMDIATKNILEDHGIALAPGRTVPLEVAKYKGPSGENKDNTHAFPVFPEGEAAPSPPEEPAPMTATSERSSPSSSLSSSSGRASSGSSVRSESRNATPASDARASSTRARSMKKGFLSAGGKGENAELYPDGSAEGIPKPGEQYDPLGHIPESVRNKCHVIDTGALKGAELEKVSRQYAETGRLDLNAPGVYAKGSAPGGKREVGIGHPSALRTGGTETGTEAGTETGSETGTMRGGEASAGREGGGGAAPSPPEPRLEARTVPTHVVSETTSGGEEALEVRIQMPLLRGGMAAVELDVGATSIGVSSPEYELTATLPRRVNADGARAKFSAKRSELRVILPISSS